MSRRACRILITDVGLTESYGRYVPSGVLKKSDCAVSSFSLYPNPFSPYRNHSLLLCFLIYRLSVKVAHFYNPDCQSCHFQLKPASPTTTPTQNLPIPTPAPTTLWFKVTLFHHLGFPSGQFQLKPLSSSTSSTSWAHPSTSSNIHTPRRQSSPPPSAHSTHALSTQTPCHHHTTISSPAAQTPTVQPTATSPTAQSS